MSNKGAYKVSVDGCDDVTEIRILLSNQEADLLEKVAKEITEASNSDCQPRMSVKGVW